MNNIARIAKLASEQEGSENTIPIDPTTVLSSSATAEISNRVNVRIDNISPDDGINDIASSSVTASSSISGSSSDSSNLKSNSNNEKENNNQEKEKEIIVLDIMKQKQTNNQESQDTFAQLLKATMDQQTDANIGKFIKSYSCKNKYP